MNKNLQKKLTGIFLIFVLLITAATGCTKKQKNDTETDSTGAVSAAPASTAEQTKDTNTSNGESKVLQWGTHWVAGLDPNHVDETTGEYTMDEASRQASLAALAKTKEELNVDVEFVQYATDTRSELVTSVLAGNPVCDIALIWGGAESTILSQNILQELDDYADLFSEPDYSWMLYDKLYGHNYFLTSKQAFTPRWPLIYNASMIEKVDSLKDDSGKTIYPTDLFQEGKWTWKTYKDYLSKIQTFYANTEAPDACAKDTVQAYETDWRFAGLSAMYTAGGGIYGANGLLVDSAASLKGTAYIKELIDSKVLTDPGVYDDGFTPVWCQGATDFKNGGTVFTDCPDWLIAGSSTAAAARGESVGIVPWPRPDDLAQDDENYRQVLTVGDSMGILKGVDKETTKLALEFLKVYYSAYYEALGGVDSVLDYKKSAAATQATSLGFDIFNEAYGDDLLKTFQYIADKTAPNDYSDLLGLRGVWDTILGKSLYGIDGYAAYDVSIKSDMNKFTDTIHDMETILASGEVRDNIAPVITAGAAFAYPKGTDPSTIKFSDHVTINDAVDGVLDATAAKYEYSTVDFKKVGSYEKGLKVTMKDKSDNEGTLEQRVIIYNPDNKKPPVIKAKEGYRSLKVDEDASAVNWKSDFIESALDADGLDVSGNITADISNLDTTTAGEYDVVITVSDYAGNKCDITLKVKVEAAE